MRQISRGQQDEDIRRPYIHQALRNVRLYLCLAWLPHFLIIEAGKMAVIESSCSRRIPLSTFQTMGRVALLTRGEGAQIISRHNP